jgi:hypothetical protein
MKKLIFNLFIACVVIALTGCRQVNQRIIPTSGIFGYIENVPVGEGDVYVYAVPYIPNTDGSGGTFFLQKAVHSKTLVSEDGFFHLDELGLVSTMDYATLLVSPEMRETGDLLYRISDKSLVIIDMKLYQSAGVLDVGKLSVSVSQRP